MAFTLSRKSVTALICLACGLGTLFLMVSGSLAIQRILSLQKKQVAQPAQDPLVRSLTAMGVWLRGAELSFRGELVRRGRMAPISPDLMFLAIDDLSIGIDATDLEASAQDIPRESRDFRALSLMSQGWPFSREVHALALDKLIQAGARAILVDVVFVKPFGGDRALQAALERHREKVTIVCNFVPATGEGGTTDSGAGKNVFQFPPASLLPIEGSRDVIGMANFFPDLVDGSIWAARYRVSERELGGFPAIADPNDEILALSAKAAVKIRLAQHLPPGRGATQFRFAGPPSTFKPKSFQEIFFPRYWERNFQNGATLKDKIIILGPFGNWAQDFQPTPLGAMPGPEVHLQALNALLTNSFLHETPNWLAVAEVMAACLGVGFLARSGLRPFPRFLLAIGGGAVLILAAVVAYNRFDTYLITVPPLFALVSSSFLVFVHEFSIERLERARTRKFLERTMSSNMVRAVLDRPGFYEKMKAGQRLPVTILFSDIRSFTTMTESADEAALVVQLNEYMNRMVESVFAHNGVLDKFIGDAVMAVWGNTPESKGPQQDAVDAVQCALEMLERLRELNVGWKAEGRPELHIGIGINSGEVIAGEIGSAQKMEMTVIGDAVNTASRFESLTKEYHLELLIGENTAAFVKDRFVLQHADFNTPKGKTKHVEVFTVRGEDKDGLRSRLEAAGLSDYEEGLRQYRKRDAAAALTAFEKALAARPDDYLIERYARLAAARLAEGENAVWTDVTVMTKK